MPSKQSGDHSDEPKPKSKPKLKPPQNPNPNPSLANPPNPNSKSPRSRAATDDDRMTILRAAVEFKRKTGAAPTGSTSVAFFETLRGLIDENLTVGQVFNKLRHFREKFSQSPKKDDDACRLSVELWPVNSDKKESKGSQKKKDKGGKEKIKNMVEGRGGEKAKNMETDIESEEEEEEEENVKLDKNKEIKKKKDNKDSKEKDNYVIEPKKMEVDSESEEEEEVDRRVEENGKLDKKKEIKEIEKKKDKRDTKEKNNYVIEPRGSENAIKSEVHSESEEETEENKVENEEDEEEEEDEDEEEDKKVVKKAKVAENGRESGIESLDYVMDAVKRYWKANGLLSVTLEEGLKLVDPVKARDLEEKWKRLLNDEMRLLLDWSKTSHELLVNLHGVHKDMKI